MEHSHALTQWSLDDSVRPVRVVADGLIVCEIPPHAAGLDIEIGRRIAAAPDLLHALQGLVKELSDSDEEGLIEHAEPMIAARAAIAKATGTQS